MQFIADGLKRFVQHDLSAPDPKRIYVMRLDLRGAGIMMLLWPKHTARTYLCW